MSTLKPDKIVEVMSGYMLSWYIFAARRLRFFERLGERPFSAKELAENVGIGERKAGIILSNLESAGLVTRDNGAYRNSPEADHYLTGKVPDDDMRPCLRFYEEMSCPAWTRFPEAVKTDGPIFGNLEFTPEQQKIFTEGVESVTTPTARALAESYDFSQHRSVLDLGGGRGSYGIWILERHPGVFYTLFEWPQVAKLARERFVGHKLAGKVEIHEGDFFRDPLPGNHDCVLVANVIHLYTPEENLELLRCIRKGVPDGAKLLLVDYFTGVSSVESPITLRWSGEFMMFSGGKGGGYSQQEILDLLAKTGWKYNDTLPLTSYTSCVIAEAIGSNA